MPVVTATILSDGNPIPPPWDVLSIDICREVGRIPSAEIRITDGDAAQQRFAISNEAF